jgi:signal transduction histidine kinase
MAYSVNAPQRRLSPAAALLRQQRETIQTKWLERVRAELGGARGQPGPALLDNLPQMLEQLAEVLERPDHAGHEGDLFARHAEARIDWTTYSADELMREYGILRKVLFSVLEAEHSLPSAERDLILDFIDHGVQIGSARFTDARRFHERLEMQYLKLIELLVAESAEADSSGGPERLLDVILKGLDAEAAAFFLYSEETLELTLSSAAATSPQLAELYRGALALSVANMARSAQSEAVRCMDLESLTPGERESLKQLGAERLVWIKILAGGRLPGALCLGFGGKRLIDPAELHLLEILGERLALLLSSMQLQAQSRAALERARRESDMIEAERNKLDDERRQRDELIAAISHDMKNPLHTARLGAELIRRGPTTASATERLAEQILKSIGQSDRMIHDLLDGQRLRAGKRLPLKIEEYRMNDLVEEVVQDFTGKHGERFAVHAEPNVNGFWSWDGMRRTLENLLSNAVKYSDPHSEITILLRVVAGKMTLSVHNHGPALSAADQLRIFKPFERATSAERSGKQGWGIGLTLVQGIVDAHGGTVTVESTPDGGTTFTIANPMDSRPYQGAAD